MVRSLVTAPILLALMLVVVGCEQGNKKSKKKSAALVAFEKIKIGMTLNEAKPYIEKIKAAFPPKSDWSEKYFGQPEGKTLISYKNSKGQKVLLDLDSDKVLFKKEKRGF